MKRKLFYLLIILIVLIPEFTYADSDEEIELPEEDWSSAAMINISDEDLLMQYIDHNIESDVPTASSRKSRKRIASRRTVLTEDEQFVYDSLKANIGAIASGELSDTRLAVSAAEMLGDRISFRDGRWIITKETLGVDNILDYDESGNASVNPEARSALKALMIPDGEKILFSLLADCPYDLYWYDKTTPLQYGFENAKRYATADYFYYKEEPIICFAFPVAASYSLTGETGTTDIDTAKTGAAAECIEAVSDILDSYSDLSDLDKLHAYKEEICSRTDYNYDAEGNSDMPYGDPWQIIWVFDNDPDTEVVCEGYSKAFQFLCDKTAFSDSRIGSSIASGTLTLASGKSGDHMWNVISMDDGMNYLADITNCDEGSTFSDKLFLSGCIEGSVDDGFRFDTAGNGDADHTYSYSPETRRIYSDEELILSSEDYDPGNATCPHDYSDWETVKAATCTDAGVEKRICSLDSSHIEIRETDPLGHDYVFIAEKAATCAKPGMKAHYECFRCEAVFDENKNETVTADIMIPKSNDHSYGSWETVTESTAYTEGMKERICTVCGRKETEYLPKKEKAKSSEPEIQITRDKEIKKTAQKTTPAETMDLPAVKISRPKAVKKTITVRWKKVSKRNRKKIDGIEIQYSKDHFRTIAGTRYEKKSKTSMRIKGLKSKKQYWVRIRAYRNAADGRHVSAWKTKSIKAK